MRFFARYLALAAAILAAAPAVAFDATKYVSPTYNTPRVDKLIIQSPGSTGPLDGMSVLGRPIETRARDQLNFLDYGAKTDGSFNDTALASWLAAISTTGKCGYVPGGRYVFASQIDFRIPAGAIRYCIRGDDALFVTTTTASPAVQFRSPSAGGTALAFYPIITGMRFEANVNGVAVAIGNADFSDQINAATIDIVANNSSTGTNAVVLQLNSIYWSSIKAAANGSSPTNGLASIQIRQTQFSNLSLAPGHSAVGLHLTGGYSYANTFVQTDVEETTKSVLIDSAFVTRNTFLGGTFVYRGNGITATAGSANLMIMPNIAPQSGAPGPSIVSQTGLQILDNGSSYVLGALGYTPISQAAAVAANKFDVQNGSNVLRFEMNSAGTAYLTNFVNGQPLAYSVQSGGAHSFNVAGAERFKVDGGGIYASGLPTSAIGLPSGALWRDSANGNALKVVP
ncbi:hypothetical protein ACFZ8E_25190 [Methylobacterium sp. HMF5984]|uniref:hypothetical protein n=1 Tax=Methylobacterium sp. HMF5984 TaxID=3367370 RepID=UPI003852DAD4